MMMKYGMEVLVGAVQEVGLYDSHIAVAARRELENCDLRVRLLCAAPQHFLKHHFSFDTGI